MQRALNSKAQRRRGLSPSSPERGCPQKSNGSLAESRNFGTRPRLLRHAGRSSNKTFEVGEHSCRVTPASYVAVAITGQAVTERAIRVCAILLRKTIMLEP